MKNLTNYTLALLLTLVALAPTTATAFAEEGEDSGDLDNGIEAVRVEDVITSAVLDKVLCPEQEKDFSSFEKALKKEFGRIKKNARALNSQFRSLETPVINVAQIGDSLDQYKADCLASYSYNNNEDAGEEFEG